MWAYVGEPPDDQSLSGATMRQSEKENQLESDSTINDYLQRVLELFHCITYLYDFQ